MYIQNCDYSVSRKYLVGLHSHPNLSVKKCSIKTDYDKVKYCSLQLNFSCLNNPQCYHKIKNHIHILKSE